MTDAKKTATTTSVAGSSRPLIAALASAGLLVAGALGAYALVVEPQRLELTRPVVPIPNLPEELDGISVLLLADPHVQHWGRREGHLVAILNELENPDIIVWAGDLIHGKIGIPHALRLCKAVADRFRDVPTFAVMGNAEHKMRLEFRLGFIDQLKTIGIHVLLNEWEPLSLRGQTIAIVGVDDPYYGHADLPAALEAPPAAGMFRMLLAHSPQIATQAAKRGIDFMLSGHTHGGQVRLPLIGPLKTQNPLSRRLDMGIFDRSRLATVLGRDPGGDLITYISRGVGVATLPRAGWIAPRLLCRPEAALLTLRRSRDAFSPL